MDSYPVLWRDEGQPISVGKLVFGQDALELSGAAADRHLVSEELPYADIAAFHIGRRGDDRLNGNRALIIERREHTLVEIAVLGAGFLGEVADLLTRLAA
jgi:hypothetical protein